MYSEAIPYYLKEIDNADKEIKLDAMAKLANCYRLTGQFEEAEDWYKKIFQRRRRDPENSLNYARALKSSAKYAEAAKEFTKYAAKNPSDPMGKIYVRSCDLAQQWLDEPSDLEVRNAVQLNTEAPEYAPVYYKDGIIFTSARKGGVKKLLTFDGGNNVALTDLYYVSLKNTHDKLAIDNMNHVNSSFHEGPAAIHERYDIIYFTRTVAAKNKSKTDKPQEGKKKDAKEGGVVSVLQIYRSKLSEKDRTKATNNFPFNSIEYSTGHPSLSRDGKSLYFMSDRPGGFGGTDIYVSHFVNGIWSEPINLGPEVNTFGYELFPYIHQDGKLYFASDTHPGMGKLDIFSAEQVNGKWTNIANLKPPINSIGDDFGIVMTKDGRKGFFGSNRFNGVGSDDLYTFIIEKPKLIFIHGTELAMEDESLYDGIIYKLSDDETKVKQLGEHREGFVFFQPELKRPYTLSARKDGFSNNKINLTMTGETDTEFLRVSLKPQKKSIMVNGIVLHELSVPEDSVSIDSISDKISMQPVKSAIVLLKQGGQIIEKTVTNRLGEYYFNAALEPGNEYTIIETKTISNANEDVEFSVVIREEERKKRAAAIKLMKQEKLAKEASEKILANKMAEEAKLKAEAEALLMAEAGKTAEKEQRRLEEEKLAKEKEEATKKTEAENLVKEAESKRIAEEQRLAEELAIKKEEEERREQEVAAKKLELESMKQKAKAKVSAIPKNASAGSLMKFKGKVISAGEPVKDAQVKLLNNKGTVVNKGTTSDRGEFLFDVESAGSYSVYITLYGYFDKYYDVKIDGGNENNPIAFELNKQQMVKIDGQISTKEASRDKTHIRLSNEQNFIADSKTTKTGEFSLDLIKDRNYEITATKKGYFQSDIQVSTFGKKTNEQMNVDVKLEKLEVGKTVEIKNLYYDLNSAKLRYESFFELKKVMLFLEVNPTVKIELWSHADARGSNQYNVWLSQRRADVVAEFLTAEGIKRSRISTKAFGETLLAISNASSESQHQLNRRTEFKIIEL